jgi:hypothetical protein
MCISLLVIDVRIIILNSTKENEGWYRLGYLVFPVWNFFGPADLRYTYNETPLSTV